MRDVGNMGEGNFVALCSATYIAANLVKIDKRGWDYFLEFPIEFDDNADLTPSPIRCLVQVKSTDDKERTSERITIKNLLYFVKLQMPAFFCFMKYDGEVFPQAIFLMHVGDEIIRNTLHTVRKLHSAGNVKFNKEELTIKFRKEHRIGSISGSALKEAIEQHIPNGMEQYVKDKIDKINNIGYENGYAKGTFNVNEKNPANAILNCSLGITDKLNVSNFIVFDQRFAISSKNPIINSESGRMFFDPKPTGTAQIIFSKEKSSKGIIFNADWYSSGFNELVSKEEQRFRIANSYIELVFYPLKERIDFTLLKNYKGENLKN